MISAIIATYNREKYLPACINSLLNQTLDKTKYEIVIINNNSTDQTEQISRQFIANNPNFNIQYFVESNQGLSYSRNRGVKEANGDILTFVDDDATLAPDFLEVCYSFLQSNSKIAGIGGKILLNYESEKPEWASKYLESLFGYYNNGANEKEFKFDYPRGSNMTYLKSVLNEVGGFNVDLGRAGKGMQGGEEKDLAKRLQLIGEKLMYVPTAVVYHAVPLERTQLEFVKNQATGVGASESLRMQTELKFGYIRFIFKELFKWAGTLLLALGYFVKGQLSKANMLINFRYWVTKGGL